MNDYLAYRVKYSDELYHYGVKGQKWGIRRYQNPDGSLTDEGLIRYGVDRQGNMSPQGKSLYNKTKNMIKLERLLPVPLSVSVPLLLLLQELTQRISFSTKNTEKTEPLTLLVPKEIMLDIALVKIYPEQKLVLVE